MGAIKFPHCHMLIAACYEAIAVVRIELYPEYRQVARISESKRPRLFPLKHLNRESLVHAHGDYLIAICRELKLKHPALV